MSQLKAAVRSEDFLMPTTKLVATPEGAGLGLRKQREAVGLTQVEVARRARCSVSYVRLLESGPAPHWSRVLPDVCRVLAEAAAEVHT